MEVEFKKIKVVEEIVLTHATVPKGTNGQLVIKTDARKEGFIISYNKYFTDLTPEITEKIKEMEK